jgi:hypothetical protein
MTALEQLTRIADALPEAEVTRHDRHVSYLGARGWIAVRLDTPEVDWDEVADLVTGSYRLVAPKRLVREL